MAKCGDYEILREGEEVILRIDCNSCTFFPSIEDNPTVMSLVIDILVETGLVTKIVLAQKRDYEYGYEQTVMLHEIAQLFKELQRYNFSATLADCQKYIAPRYADLQTTIHGTIKSDPIGAYVEIVRMERREKELTPVTPMQCSVKLGRVLNDIKEKFENTKLIQLIKDQIAGYQTGDRTLYSRYITSTTKPDFMYTRLMAAFPPEGTELARYEINGTEVTIFSLPNTVQYLYHIVPPEFKLSEEKYELIDTARNLMAEHKPKRSEFVDPERMRQVFTSIGNDLLDDLAKSRGITLRTKEREELAQILVRYTVGFGLIEVLLGDDKVQDITINTPMGRTPVFIVHADYGDCTTNIMPAVPEAESWASKLRLISGRPLDEANPILDTELVLPNARARVAAITAPLNPTGIAFALRRHRDKPWTLPLFIKAGMMDALCAGLISFLVDGSRTILVAGTRSAGKTSLLGGVMVEIMRKGRIITIEDTLELPVEALRKLNYNIQSMKVASALTRGTTEVSADEGIRTTLRLGDSSLIVGEVRSTEAKALYEAMRVGALANVVAGTIHGDSPYGVFDRVVNDLEVPRTSFKATDIIIVANPIRSPDGIHRWRRVTQITEIRKEWEDDPLAERGFVDLMKYDAAEDKLLPSKDLLAGDSDIIKNIASNVKEWAGNWDAVWDNILLRAKIKQTLVDTSKAMQKADILESDFYILANDEFHKISEQVREEVGTLDSKRIFFEWNEWLQRNAKRL